MAELDSSLEKSKDSQRTFTSAQELLKSLQEAKRPEGELYTKCKDMVSAEGRQKLLDETEVALSDPVMQQIGAIEEESQEVSRRFNEDEINGEEFGREKKRLRHDLFGNFDKEQIAQYRGFIEQREHLSRGEVYIARGRGADVLAGMLSTAQNVEATNQAHTFVSPNLLQRFERRAADQGNKIEIVTNREIKIPVGMFVSAEGFESWEGRPQGDKKGDRPSGEVIEDYAGRSTPIPEVEELFGYVLPDGRVYFKTFDSHRVAAAIKRGDGNIPFRGRVNLFLLNEVSPEF